MIVNIAHSDVNLLFFVNYIQLNDLNIEFLNRIFINFLNLIIFHFNLNRGIFENITKLSSYMGTINKEMFHTQEHRGTQLTCPIKCLDNNAWLGQAYYFWEDEEDAMRWGRDSKRRTGRFGIYKALIVSDNILDTVYVENEYKFWLKQVEKVAKVIFKQTKRKATIKQINEYFFDKNLWNDIDGILFQDLPTKQEYLLVIGFYYRKRIQLALYNISSLRNFYYYNTLNC